MTSTTPTFADALALAQRLPPVDQARLAQTLLAQLVTTLDLETTTSSLKPPLPFPVLHGGTWPDDLPLRREELYDDRGRA